jgi:deazaflavin-dependent oxidoreductase (nitroreductase family)
MRTPLLNPDERLRRMYAGRRGNSTARAYARLWAVVFGLGVLPRRWVTLEVPGRKTGRPTRFPLGMARVEQRWYLVSMLGECHWTRNVRANGGRAVLRRRGSRTVLLIEVVPEERAPIIRHYLHQVPGGRPHIPVDKDAPPAEFEAIAARYPVFEVTSGS